MNLKNNVSLLLVTHYAPRETYGYLSPPSAGIIKKTISSFREKMAGLQNCKHYIVYNTPENYSINKGAKEYHKNIQEFSDDNNIEVITQENEGLRNALSTGLSKINTKYTLFLEHDWKLVENINLPNIAKTFKQNDNMNSIRFSRRKNTEAGWDTHVVEDRSKPVPLCKTSNAGNQPQVVRTDTLERWVKLSAPNIVSATKSFYQHYDTLHDFVTFGRSLYARYILQEPAVRYFDDMEKILDTKFKKDISERGFQKAHEKWGIYLYGYRDEGPYVEHLGR